MKKQQRRGRKNGKNTTGGAFLSFDLGFASMDTRKIPSGMGKNNLKGKKTLASND